MKPPQPVTVRFELTERDFTDGLRTITRRQPTFWVGPLLGVATLSYGLAAGDSLARVWGTVLLLLTAASLALVPRLRWRHGHVAGEQQHTFATDGITVRAAGQQGQLPWDFYEAVAETPRVYVLLRSRKQGNFIPRRAFESPDDEERFRSLLAAKGLLPGGRGEPGGGIP